MPNVDITDVSRAQGHITVARLTPKVTNITLRRSSFFFWEDYLFAVSGDGVLYFLDREYAAAQTRFMNELSRKWNLAQLRVSPRDFDFITGSTLTKLGLMLTRAPKEEK